MKNNNNDINLNKLFGNLAISMKIMRNKNDNDKNLNWQGTTMV